MTFATGRRPLVIRMASAGRSSNNCKHGFRKLLEFNPLHLRLKNLFKLHEIVVTGTVVCKPKHSNGWWPKAPEWRTCSWITRQANKPGAEQMEAAHETHSPKVK